MVYTWLARARPLEAQHAREEGLTPEELRKLRARKTSAERGVRRLDLNTAKRTLFSVQVFTK